MPSHWSVCPDDDPLFYHYHALGVISTRWNISELHLQQLCWLALPITPEKGGAITFSMGNRARTDLILTAIRADFTEPSPIADHFKFCVTLFNKNKENRNFLTHRRLMKATGHEEHKLGVIQGFSANGKISAKMYLLSVEQIQNVADEIQDMNDFFRSFINNLPNDPDDFSSLVRPHLPRTLAEKLPSWNPGS